MANEGSDRPGRNDPCHCGSGRKYKRCCLEEDERKLSAARAEAIEAAASETSDASEERAPKRPPKPQTQQPWKNATSKGFAPANRMPRKVGGS